MTDKKDCITQAAFDQILLDAFLPADRKPPAATPAAYAAVPLQRDGRVSMAEAVSYAIASQPERLEDARRRSTLTPEPTKSTLIDLRYKRLANHKAAKRPDEISRIMNEFPDGEYNDAFNKISEGKLGAEPLPVFEDDNLLEISEDENRIQSREEFEAEYYRYTCAANALLLLKIDDNGHPESAYEVSFQEALLAAKGEHDVVADFENSVYAFLCFDTGLEGANEMVSRLAQSASGFTVSIGFTLVEVGEQDQQIVIARAEAALSQAIQKKSGSSQD